MLVQRKSDDLSDCQRRSSSFCFGPSKLQANHAQGGDPLPINAKLGFHLLLRFAAWMGALPRAPLTTVLERGFKSESHSSPSLAGSSDLNRGSHNLASNANGAFPGAGRPTQFRTPYTRITFIGYTALLFKQGRFSTKADKLSIIEKSSWLEEFIVSS